MTSNRKTLRKKAAEYHENIDLFSSERANAKSLIIFGELKLKFLDWLEKSNAHNTEFEWETEQFSEYWDQWAWQQAVVKLSDDLRSDGFFINVIGNVSSYTIKVALWDKEASKDKREVQDFRDSLLLMKSLPSDIKGETDILFRALFNLHEKDNNFDHPKYSEFQKIIFKIYKKDMKVLAVKEALLKSRASLKGESYFSKLLKSFKVNA